MYASLMFHSKMYCLVSPDEADPNQGIFAGEIYVPVHTCTAQSIVYGCTAIESNSIYPYPYENDNPVIVSIETDYLLDVVSQEMGSAGFHLNARHAQAIVARSYAYHREHFDTHTGTPVMDNSTASQVFIPYRFEKWDKVINFSPNYYNPCLITQSNSLLPQQKRICNAVNASKNYVTGINHVYDLPETPLFGNNAPQIRDQQGVSIIPDDRWNPLSIDWGTSNNQPPVLQHGNTYPIIFELQNTGTDDWDCNFPSETYVIKYRWTRNGNQSTGTDQVSVCGIDKGGASQPLNLTIQDIPNWGAGTYGLHFDIESINGANRLWSTYTVLVCVGNESCGNSFLPLVAKSD